MTEEERMCQGITGPMRDEALAMARNVVFLRRQMESEREVIEHNGFHTFVVETVGRGSDKHKVMRENKAMTGYLQLSRAYAEAVSRFSEMLDGAGLQAQKPEAKVTPLELIRGRKAG